MGKVEIKYKYEDCSSTFLQRQHLYRQKLKYHKKWLFLVRTVQNYILDMMLWNLISVPTRSKLRTTVLYVKSILRETSIVRGILKVHFEEQEESKCYYCRKICTRDTIFDTHVAKCKNTRRITRSKSKTHDSSKNISVVNTSTDIGDIAVTALMHQSNNDQNLFAWNEVVILLSALTIMYWVWKSGNGFKKCTEFKVFCVQFKAQKHILAP